MLNKIRRIAVLCGAFSCLFGAFLRGEEAKQALSPSADLIMRFRKHRSYPGFDDHPYLTKKMRDIMRPYLLPLNHPVKKTLDKICLHSRIILNPETFKESGFHVLHHQRISKIRVASHPELNGYLVKVYLDCETVDLKKTPGWLRLARRCEGAKNVRDLIKRKGLKHFTVPRKWLYFPPVDHLPEGYTRKTMQPALLVVTDMNIVSLEESLDAWWNKISTEHLDELYCILSHGFASAYLPFNIPYCKNGKFACVDTENPKREVKVKIARPYLSPEMLAYWDRLTQDKEEK